MSHTSELAPQMNIQKFNPFSKNRDLIRVNVYYDWRNGITGFIARQFAVVLVILLSIIMAGPLPGPGTLPLVLLIFLASYPGKRRLVAWLWKKRFFRIGRYIMRNRYRILLVTPRDRKNLNKANKS